MDSLAVTDHGNLYGAVDFYLAAKDAGIRPIIGCEMYVANEDRRGRSPNEKSPYHLTVLSKDLTGYRNLVKLVSAAHLEGFYYKPRVDKELLERHSPGLIVLSGCPSGEVPRRILEGRMDEARAAAAWYREVFGDYYLEVMRHGDVEDLPAINRGLLELNGDTGIPVVATNDSHYVRQEEASLHDILLCIQTNTSVNDQNRLRMSEDSYYLKSPEEMQDLFSDLPEAVSNSQRIADMCDLDLDFSSLHLPEFEVPEGVTADGYLSQLAWQGLRRRIESVSQEVEDRLSYELEVIRKTRYADYFLVAWDIGRFVREHDIYLAVRGSAAASLTLYCLGVTDVNPLEYGLVFERFLNVERKEMPDIDLDFQDDRREEVLNYVVSRYGREHVAQIITFGTLGAKASIRDVGRALAMPYAEADRVARAVPTRLHITLDEAVEHSPELREIYEAEESIRKLVDTAKGLEGVTRHASTHAAGVVISAEPLDTHVPLQRPIKGDDDSISMTQYAMEPIAALGLLKMDFLGLANLTILAKARDLIANEYGVELSLRDIPLDDVATFELLTRGDTVGVFQLEGAGMTRYIKDLKPSSVADVAAMIALYRPGPMEHIGTFIDAKHGHTRPEYPHDALRKILEETYGVIVYQDQVLLIAQAFAGYSLGEADIVRKAMGKKVPEIMAKERASFIQGALGQGYTKDLAETVFALIEPFAGYAFGKAHAVSYGLISYWTAYLKANYPAEFMVSLLNAYAGNTEKTAGSVAECHRLRISVLGPDVNHSEAEFSIERPEDGARAVRFGLAAIKNVGAAAVQPLIDARKRNGAFTSLEEMCREADMSGLNRKTLESLVKAGALDSFGDRGAILERVDRIVGLAQSEASLKDSNQASMFDLFGESVPTPLASISLSDIETSERERGKWESELLGVKLAGRDDLNNARQSAAPDTIVSLSQISSDMAGERISLLGEVDSTQQRLTKEQKPFAIATIGLLDDSVDVFIWQDRQDQTRGVWETGNIVEVVGSIRVRDDQISVSCVSAREYDVSDRRNGSRPSEPPPVANGSIYSDGIGEVPVAPTYAVEPGPESAAPVAQDGNGTRPSRQRGSGNGHVASEPAAEAGRRPMRLSLMIRESGAATVDPHLIGEIRGVLLEFQGRDEVWLEIAIDGRIVTMEWPLLKVDACPELEHSLMQVLGRAGHVSVVEAEL